MRLRSLRTATPGPKASPNDCPSGTLPQRLAHPPREGGVVNKYGAKKTTCRAGHSHASKKEAGRCDQLHLLQRAGEIESLKIQPAFSFTVNGVELKHDNGRRAGYTADFSYIDRREAVEVVEDTKGYAARDWPLRKALFRACFPALVLREV